MKKCTKCKELKSLDNFNKDSQKKDGKQSHCKKCNSDKCKLWVKNNPLKQKEAVKVWMDNNPNYLKEWNKFNPGYHKKWFQNKIESNPLFKLSNNIKPLIWASFNNKKEIKSKKTEEILGCTLKEFKHYIESKFEPWMNWDNKGKYNGNFNSGWDLDHIIPISSAKNKDEIIKLNHYTNYQPLCSKINRFLKKDRLDY
jgi:hypothetical protein